MFRKSPWLILLALTILQFTVAAEEAERYEIVGRLTDFDGHALYRAGAIVILSAVGGPFSAEAAAEQDGTFSFRSLEPGLYSVVAAVPHTREARKTVELGPGFTDARRRVEVELRLQAPAPDAHTVTVTELAVPEGARQEHAKSRMRLIRRDIKGAIACLKRALALAPWFAAAWNDLGTIAYQSQQYDQAETCFRQALKQEPELYSPLVNLGTVLLYQKRTAESLTVNRQAVSENPNDPMAQAQLGMSYLYAKNDELALMHLKKAKQLDASHFTYPQLALAQIYTRRMEYAAAAREYDDFLRRHPTSRLVPTIKQRLEKVRGELK